MSTIKYDFGVISTQVNKNLYYSEKIKNISVIPPAPSSPSRTSSSAPHLTHSPASDRCYSQDPPASLALPKDSPSPAEDTIHIPHPPASSKAAPPPRCASEFPFPANTPPSHPCPQSYHVEPQWF